MEYFITDHEYRIKELESMMNYEGGPDTDFDPSYSPPSHIHDSGWDYHHNENNNDTNNMVSPPGHYNSAPSLMDVSPDTSFSTLDPNSVLSRRHVPLPTRMDLGKSSDDSSILRQEIFWSPSFTFPFPNHVFDISPDQFTRKLNFSNILHIGTFNVQSIVHPAKQLNLFSLLLSHQLHRIILTETNLQSPTYKYVCEPYISQYNYQKWFSFSSSINHHAGISIILHSSLAVYVIKKRFYKDRLISILLQLPGRQDTLIIGAYIPPSNSSNSKLISDCHSTLISWITAARSAGTHVLIGGDLNAEFDLYLKRISNPTISSPYNPLFQYLHSHLFDDLCAFDPSRFLYLPLNLQVLDIYPSWIIFRHLPLFLLLICGRMFWISQTHSCNHVHFGHFNTSKLSRYHIKYHDEVPISVFRGPALSYLKQRLRYRTEHDVHTALPDQKALFTSEVDIGLKKLASFHGNGNLNRNWHRLKIALNNAARSAFTKRIISLNKP
ncbi:unnamed protein product [Rhizophagus irregularis]|nr:unnamed protein product [Rhizophagus irregularis]